MSTYVLSDVHGQYNAYKKMLEKIQFSEKDFLYVLGDVIDRGPEGIRLIQDIMQRENAELLLGNHECMLLNALEYLRQREAGNLNDEVYDGFTPYELWVHPCNGGEGTCLELLSMPEEERNKIEEYLKSLYLIRRIKIGEQSYHLSHSYSLNKRFGKGIKYAGTPPKQVEEIVWESMFDKRGLTDDYERPWAYVRDIYVMGHIFTQRLGELDESSRGCIYEKEDFQGYHVIDIDCGMALNSRSSQLGCLCLDTGKRYYVPLLED
ncbi:MAG: metallophosphoesterase [Lachnospiraceae bacterium]|nr:metallophosphoesterase [Lachnospiraceae bacterium]MDE6743519.1 metallophosphoesterase [Lachnospiraceae bacterium]